MNRAERFKKGLLELVGRSDSDRVGDSATRQSVPRYHCNVQGVTMYNRSLKQTAISLSSCEAEFYSASACAGELLENSSRNCNTTFQFVSRWIQSRYDTCCSAEDEADSIISKYDAWLSNSGYEKNVCGPRTQSLARKLGLRILEGTLSYPIIPY